MKVSPSVKFSGSAHHASTTAEACCSALTSLYRIDGCVHTPEVENEKKCNPGDWNTVLSAAETILEAVIGCSRAVRDF